MRAFVVIFAVVACNTSSSTVTPPPSTTATASSAPPAPPPVPSAPPPSIPQTPLFTYIEGGDELTFTAPTWLRLERKSADGGKHACVSELSTGKDNMWTGPDVQNAFLDKDVQAALHGGTVHYFDASEATLRTDKGTIEWSVRPCLYCTQPAPGLEHLRKVLTVVMMNRRSLCP